MKLKTFFCENLKKKMKWKTFFVKIWWKKEIVMVYLSQIMPSCVNLNLSSPKMWAKFTHIHFSSPKIWAKNEPRSWVNWKKDHSHSHLPSSDHHANTSSSNDHANVHVIVMQCCCLLYYVLATINRNQSYYYYLLHKVDLNLPPHHNAIMIEPILE